MTGSTKAKQQASGKAEPTQYEQVAMSSLRICENYITQLQDIAAVLATAIRRPALTQAEQTAQLRVLRGTLAIAEKYTSDAEADYTLFATIAQDARGLPAVHMTPGDAAGLLAERAVDMVKENTPRARAARTKHHAPEMRA
ncbi:hypothetical protein [Caballeronia sp. BR00000012568055]|uniref:hypothetical protein n=1 Tax=Caballeronia sp. BR00000012568055 TaxID=2918761 RepID=UPI0023F78324|nr:hypothetical protein [Caballeronia sp. BR00000012568055]